ncbi:DJ-1/PfpI family protein [Methanomicrobium antiquum]|uniref:DJ-1/PfpI family protein n=1 Tax=Methanomicrobium antiquum TaxID=487686 RepID=A0AAF0JN60_9EURY|nr:DJ-1/PfpI family protein [Methanomicrobium antiquum]MDD3978230.1 DJ-1/PfpI family protein [Methanomicrobium sp.]WFN37106.1 DJ-1/PfpI family protein [Methanomicrobium antiquum]
MKILMVIAPKRYREEEFEIPAKAFLNAGVSFDVASTKTGICEGMVGGEQEASLLISDASEENYDGIVIVGGLGASDFLWKEEPLVELVKQFYEKDKVVGAICLAPVVLARAGILKDKQATVFETPASVELLKQGGANIVKVPVVSDNNIITANHPTAAEGFADIVLEKLGC